MTRLIRTTLFPLLSLFFIGTAAFVSLDSFRGYQAEISIIVLPKGNSAAADQIVENIALLPTTLDFFDTLLASDERLTEFSTLDEGPVPVRKKTWEDMLGVKRQKGSGIITYTVHADTQEEAVLLSRQMVKTLFEKVGVYYDIRSEVSLRLEEGPFVRTIIDSPIQWIATSLFAGISLALIVTALILKIGNLFSSRQKREYSDVSRQRTHDSELPSIHPTTFVPKKPVVLFSESGEAKAREEKWNQVLAVQEMAIPIIEPVLREVPKPALSIAKNTAAAPDNLPVIDEAQFLAQFSSKKTVSDEETLPEEMHIPTPSIESVDTVPEESMALPSEPTVEDYRRRLNELLKMGK